MEDDNVLERTPASEDSIECLSTFKRTKRFNIYSQILELVVNGTRYFKCSHCAQKYKSTGGTQNMREHLIKNHSGDGLTTVRLKRKRENIGIER